MQLRASAERLYFVAFLSLFGACFLGCARAQAAEPSLPNSNRHRTELQPAPRTYSPGESRRDCPAGASALLLAEASPRLVGFASSQTLPAFPPASGNGARKFLIRTGLSPPAAMRPV